MVFAPRRSARALHFTARMPPLLSPRLAVAVVAFGAIAGCFTSDEPPETATTAAAAVAPDWIHPVCSPAGLAPPPILGASRPTCNGPWKYDWEESHRDAPVCELYKQAYSWDVTTAGDLQALRYVDEPWTLWPTSGNYYSNTCVYRSNKLQYCTGVIPSMQCADNASARKAALWANAIPGLVPALPIPLAYRNFSLVGRGYNVQTDPPYYEDGYKYVTTRFSCESQATRLPQPTLGRFPINGCERMSDPPLQTRVGQDATAPMTEAPATPGPASEAGWTRAFRNVAPFQSPWCSTCDGAATPAEQLACYEANLAVATGSLRQSIVARMKLLYQLSGELLDASARARVLALYAEDSGNTSGPACSSAQTFGAACEGDGEAEALLLQAQLCHDLVANTAASVAVTRVEFDACVELLAATTTITDDECRVAARAAIDADLRPLFERVYPDLTGDLATVLPPVLRRLSTWRIAVGEAAAGDATWLAAASARMLGSVWTKLLVSRRPLPAQLDPSDPAARTAAAQLVTAIERDDLTVDLAVLNAIVTDGMPVSPVILALVGDALAGMSDRIADNQRFHDVGCALLDCKPGAVARASALAQLTTVLAALPRATEFSNAVDAATLVSAQHPALWAVLDGLRDRYPTLVAAWASTGAAPDDLARLDELAAPPPEAARLAGIVRTARVTSAAYRTTGRFSAAFSARPSTAALQPQQLAARLTAQRGTTATARAEYDAARVDEVNLALEAARANGAVQAVLDRAGQIAARKQVIVDQLAGLFARELAERRRMADYQQGFEAIVDTLGEDYEYDAVALPTLQPSAASARFPATATEPNLTRDAFAMSTLATGETLRFGVSGQWSPSCRLRGYLARSPSGPILITVPSDGSGEFATGPRGYWASYGESKYTAHRTDIADSESADFSFWLKACLSGEAGLPTIPGASAGTSVEACTQFAYHKTHTETETDTTGDQQTIAADFAMGIRLPGTPFPSAPAGSLLAVVTPHGDPVTILDVQVVGEAHTLVAPELPDGTAGQLDVHLVVNDQKGCALPSNPSKLTVTQTRTQAVGDVAIVLAAATGDGLARIDAVSGEVLRQGLLSSAEANRLRSLAWQEAQRVMILQGHTLANLPAELRQWFESAIDASLASVDRRAQALALRIETDRLDAELDAAAHELLLANTQRYLTGLLPRLRLRALDSGEYLAVAASLAESLAVYVPQTLTLRRLTWQPSRAAGITDAAGKLIDRALVAPAVDAVRDLEALSRAVEDALNDSSFDSSPPVPQLVVVAIPYLPVRGGLTYAGPYHQVPTAAAAAFWAQARSATTARATITLSPQDLYGGTGTAARLNCTAEAPMVRRMAVFLDHGYTSDLNALNVYASATAAAAAPIEFPLVGRWFSMPAVAAGVPASLRVLGDRNPLEVQNRFSANLPPGLGANAGISPFTSFAIDMSFFRDTSLVNFADATRALYLVFEIEAREATSPVTVPGLCGVVPPAP